MQNPLQLFQRLANRLFTQYATIPVRQLNSDVYALSQADARWVQVFPPAEAHWPLPITFGERSVFFESLPAHWPAQGVLQLKNAVLAGPAGLLYDLDSVRLPWHSWHRSTSVAPPLLRSDWKRATGNLLKGTTLSLMSEFSARNYCHFMFDCIPRAKLFLESDFSDLTLDNIVVPGLPSTRREKILSQLGLRTLNIVWYDEIRGLIAEEMISPTFPGVPRCYPKWSVEFITKTFPPQRPIDFSKRRRLYVSRQKFDRKLSNFDELKNVLDEFKFEIITPDEITDSPEKFAEAEIIIGPHGAGMADVAYCTNGAKVVELVPDQNCYPYYYSLAISSGAQYYAILGHSINGNLRRHGLRSTSDFVVDKRVFAKAIGSLVES